MELLQGESLASLLDRRQKIPALEVVEILLPILSALQFAHDKGIIHRDLKPTNIMLHRDPDGAIIPKLLDFGIAAAKDSGIHTVSGIILGTPSYMSPEQIRDTEELDGRSDLFAVGSILYECITGTNPFRTPTPSATLAQVLEVEVDPDPAISPALWLEISRVLSKKRYARHASARELADALRGAAGIPPSSRESRGSIEVAAGSVGAVRSAMPETHGRGAGHAQDGSPPPPRASMASLPGGASPSEKTDAVSEVSLAQHRFLRPLSPQGLVALLGLTFAVVSLSWFSLGRTAKTSGTGELLPLASAQHGDSPLPALPPLGPSTTVEPSPAESTSTVPMPKEPEGVLLAPPDVASASPSKGSSRDLRGSTPRPRPGHPPQEKAGKGAPSKAGLSGPSKDIARNPGF
jgi:serine/threonine-protein kinase